MDLQKLREKIDTIDAQIVALYEDRMDISRQVAEYKIETGKKVFDKQREQEKLQKVKSLTHNDFNSHGIEELIEQIMSCWISCCPIRTDFMFWKKSAQKATRPY